MHYIDAIMLIDFSEEKGQEELRTTITFMTDTGWMINPAKIQVQPNLRNSRSNKRHSLNCEK